jgi:predicted MFS family arabinose efflux permease
MHLIRAVGRIYADAFRGLPADVWRLSIGLFLTRAGTMVLPFLGLYLVRELRYGVDDAATALFAFGLGSVVGSYAGGELSGRWGTFNIQIASLVLAGFGFLAVPTLHSFGAVSVAVFVASALNDAYRPSCMAAVVKAAPAAVRARAMGLMRLAANAGISIGPAVGGLLAAADYRWIFVGDAVTCWLGAAWLYFTLRGHRLRRSDADKATASAGPSLWTDGPFLAFLGLALLGTLVLFQVFNALPLYLAQDYGFSEPAIGLIFAFSTTLIVVFEMPLIKLLEGRDLSVLLGFGTFLMCAGFGLLPFGRGFVYAALAAAVWTFGEMLWLPFSNVLAAQRAAAGRTGQAMGMYSAVFSVASVLAPVVGLPVLDRYGGQVLWLAAGLMGIPLWIGMAALARRMRSTRAARDGDP